MNRSVIRSRRVVTPEGTRAASIHLAENGTIERVAAFDDTGSAGVSDHGDHVIMPGVIDSHVHVNEPGRTAWEGFETATRAAAAGGITTIADMPLNSIPPTTTVDALERKVEALEGKCHVDVALWGGAVPGNQPQLRPLLAAGVAGFKCFLVDSGVPEFPHLDRDQLLRTMEELRGTAAPLLVHAELGDFLRPPSGEPSTYESYLATRPDSAEEAAIALLLDACRDTRTAVHVVHLSAASAIPLVAAARHEALPFTAETTTHYLHFASESIPDGATEFKCAPPIRNALNRDELWRALASGIITSVVSDHSPCTPDLKHRTGGDYIRAWGGIASVQLLLPVFWSGARRRGFSLEAISTLLSAAPARLLGIDDRKGRIEAGFHADLVVWSPEAEFVVDAAALEHRNKLSPYHGERLSGVVEATYLRGSCIYERGTFAPAGGRWLKREWT